MRNPNSSAKTGNRPVGRNLDEVVRWCDHIGMFALDRPMQSSCVHATVVCWEECYNWALHRVYRLMSRKDVRNEDAWVSIDPQSAEYLAEKFQRCRSRQTRRARFMTRGEAFSYPVDVDRVAEVCNATPDTMWWCPTRAWREPLLRLLIEAMDAPNLVVLASLDPSNTLEDYEDLRRDGWSTMYFGDTSEASKSGRFLCPKNWRGSKSERNPKGVPEGHCAICKGGCFAPAVMGRRVDVHLGGSG